MDSRIKRKIGRRKRRNKNNADERGEEAGLCIIPGSGRVDYDPESDEKLLEQSEEENPLNDNVTNITRNISNEVKILLVKLLKKPSQKSSPKII